MNNGKKLNRAAKIIGPQTFPAAGFSSWLRQTRSALLKKTGVDVPCGKCNACCKSAYFIHIHPKETRTLSRIPKKFLFAAPGLPKGHVLLGYFENGRCPMLIKGACSIYAHRSLTCRNYDCRIFAAAGIAPGDVGKAEIARRLRRWKFSYPAKRDRDQHAAVQAAAKFMREHAGGFPAGAVPGNATQLAILAVKVYRVFLKYIDESGKIKRMSWDGKLAKAIMKADAKFEVGRHTPVEYA